MLPRFYADDSNRNEPLHIHQNYDFYHDYSGELDIGNSPLIKLNNHKLKLSIIYVNPSTRDALLKGGTITSTKDNINIRLSAYHYSRDHRLHIDSVITDSWHRVGLRITGDFLGCEQDSGLCLEGDQSNTFTGNVEISGRRKHLVLRKTNGAIAIRSDILVKEEALLRFEGSNQVTENITTILRTNGVLQYLADSDITNKFHNISIEGNGIIDFNHREGNSQNSKYYIKLDEIIISQGGHLEIQGWQEGRDFLLVRKDSANLNDALTKMDFLGHNRGNIHLEEFDSEYWSISSAPEPATYGAILGGLSLSLFVWCRCKRSRSRSVFSRNQRLGLLGSVAWHVGRSARRAKPHCKWKRSLTAAPRAVEKR